VHFTGEKSPLTLVFNMPLPKLYAISMMFTLNARRNIRAMRSGQYSSSDGRPTRPHRPQVRIPLRILNFCLSNTCADRRGNGPAPDLYTNDDRAPCGCTSSTHIIGPRTNVCIRCAPRWARVTTPTETPKGRGFEYY
jgi:hypothetical protein